MEVLRHVEWLALGFEVIDPPYVDGKFQPADFVAAYGLHAALVVGEPFRPASDTLATLAEQLAAFAVTLSKADVVAAQGGGKNVLRSPALCLAELASARERQRAAAGPRRRRARLHRHAHRISADRGRRALVRAGGRAAGGRTGTDRYGLTLGLFQGPVSAPGAALEVACASRPGRQIIEPMPF